MRRFIKKVTLTGADDSVDPRQLVNISDVYPFVEWGILLSKNAEGTRRFPSLDWQEKLYKKRDKLNLSGHICGTWVREICRGDWSFYKARGMLYRMYQRFQLNFHAQVHNMNHNAFLGGDFPSAEFIFQLDSVNNHLLEEARKQGLNAYGLFDLSGGAGVLPGNWVKSNEYMGYAGGLSPFNLDEQLEMIEKVCGDEI